VALHPDGSKAYYGTHNSSRTSTTYTISYWQNPQGLRISYEYDSIDSNGQNKTNTLRKIKYGGVNEGAALYSVEFSYDYRPHMEEFYNDGVRISKSYLLSRINVYSGTELIKYYTLNHGTSSLRYSRLESVQEHSGDGTLSHSPINFNYSDTNELITYNEATTTLGVVDIEQRNAESLSFDLTGNGQMDFLVYPKNNKNKFWLFKDLQNGTYNYSDEIITGAFEAIFPT